MTAFVLLNAQLYFGGRDITGLVNQTALELTRNLPDDNVMGGTTMSRLAGTRDGQVSINGFWDSGLDLEVYTEHALATSAGEVFSISAEDAAFASIAYSMEAQIASYVLGAAHGEVYPFTLELQSANPVVRGKIFATGNKAATADGAEVPNVGAVPAGGKLWAALHVTQISGGAPTIDVVIESSSNGLFAGEEVTRLTFVQAVAVGAQYLSVAGAITDTHWRATWTLGGGDNADILVVGGVTAG